MLNKEIEKLLSCDNCKLSKCIQCEISYTDKKNIREYIEHLENKVMILEEVKQSYKQNLKEAIRTFLKEQTERSFDYSVKMMNCEKIGEIMIFTAEDLSKFIKFINGRLNTKEEL